MPLYDFSCECGWEQEDFYLEVRKLDTFRCPRCNKKLDPKLGFSTTRRPFHPYWDEFMDEKPIYIESQAQRTKELRKRGLDYAPKAVGDPGCEV